MAGKNDEELDRQCFRLFVDSTLDNRYVNDPYTDVACHIVEGRIFVVRRFFSHGEEKRLADCLDNLLKTEGGDEGETR